MRNYLSLYEFIPQAFEKFSFSNYYQDEIKYLKPALEALGYTNIRFVHGERDSFGPLTRVVICTVDGKDVYYIYG